MLGHEYNDLEVQNQYGDKLPQFTSYKDNKPVKAFEVVTENKVEADNNAVTVPKAEKKQNKLLSLLISVVAVAVIAAPQILNIYSINIEEYNISAYEEGVFYYFSFGEDTDIKSLKINLYNDFVSFSNDVEEQSIEDGFYDLQPNMYYTFTITNNGFVVFQQTVYTGSEIQTSDGRY